MAPKPMLVRLLFSVTCVANMAWIGLFSQGAVNLATVVLVVLWAALLVLYLFMISNFKKNGFSMGRYVCSELGLTVYFAWTCAATLISVAVTLQVLTGAYLSLFMYIALLSILGVATISVVIFNDDYAFGLVAMWALVAVSVKTFPWDSEAVARMHMTIRACAAQNVGLVAAFILISIAVRTIGRLSHDMYGSVNSGGPLLNGKSLAHINYGSN